MQKQWIAVLSLVALLIVGSVAGSAFAQTATPADSDGGAASQEEGRDSDGDGGAGEGSGHDSDSDEGTGDSDGKARFAQLLAANLGISEDAARTALDATREQLKAERRAAWEQSLRDKLAEAVEAGKITQAEADAKLAAFIARADDSDSMRGMRGFAKGKAKGKWGFGGKWGRGDKDSVDSDGDDSDSSSEHGSGDSDSASA